jgi:hypothetical protein
MRLAAVFAVAAVACALTGCARGEPDIVVLKPVDSNGNVQRGWTAEPRSGSSSVDCSYGQPSRYDRAGGDTRECGATADSADACWPKQDSSEVICLVDPILKTLDIISASGLSAPVRAREHEPRDCLNNGGSDLGLDTPGMSLAGRINDVRNTRSHGYRRGSTAAR